MFLVQLEILGLQDFVETKARMAFPDKQGIKETEGVRCHAQTHICSHEGMFLFLLNNLDFVF